MKNNNGVTMLSLVITVLMLVLLSSLAINLEVETYSVTRIENFISQLKIIQSKVDNLVEGIDNVATYDFKSKNDFVKLSELETRDSSTYGAFLDMIKNPDKYNIDTTKSWNSMLDTEPDNYYYFSPTDLGKLGLKNQKLTVIINFQTRNIISKTRCKAK